MDILDMCYHSMYEKTLKELLNALPMKNDILTYYKELMNGTELRIYTGR